VVVEASDGYDEEIDGLRIEARALPGGPLPTLAWRFSNASQRVVVSGSGWGREVLASFAGGADVLVHEAAYLPTLEELEGTGAEIPNPERLELEAKLHTSIEEVGEIATEAQVERLVLVRLRPPPFFNLQVERIVATDFSGRVIVADDGDVVFP
jgi:ribonuclease BN (tRNA processing enzyme)